MTSLPWMPLYVADYLADTGHLSTIEHGAYLLLIMHYWQNGSLPQDDEHLARIVRMRVEHWRKIEGVLKAFFDDSWRHGRIDHEMKESRSNIEKRSAAGRAGASARYSKRNATALANAVQTDTPSPSPSPSPVPFSKENGRSAELPLNGSEAKAPKAKPPKPPDPWKEVYDTGKEVFGREAGGIITLLRKLYDQKPHKVIAKIKDAQEQREPLRWICAFLHTVDDGGRLSGEYIGGVPP